MQSFESNILEGPGTVGSLNADRQFESDTRYYIVWTVLSL